MLAIVEVEGAGTRRLLNGIVDCNFSMKEITVPISLVGGNKVAQVILKNAIHTLSLATSLRVISSAHSLLGAHALV